MRQTTALSAAAFGVCLMLMAACSPDAIAANCSADDVARAVDATGAGLRAFNSDMMSTLSPKLKRLQDKRGWSDEDLAAHTQALLADQDIANLDKQAFEQFNRIDELGAAVPPGEECQRIADIDDAGKALVGTMRTKAELLTSRIEAAMKEASVAELAKPAAPASPAATVPSTAPAAPAKPKAKADTDWTSATLTAPDPSYAAQKQASHDNLKLPVPSTTEGEATYSIDEIKATSDGFFGTITSNLASVIAYAFEKAGRPNGYILGQEAGGAFLAGVRYGDGKLYMKDGIVTRIYWRGPSLGADLGASQSRTMILVYHLKSRDDAFKPVPGLDGSAFVVGGVGITFLSDGKTIYAPIGTGPGLRLGVNAGYLKFTRERNWVPF